MAQTPRNNNMNHRHVKCGFGRVHFKMGTKISTAPTGRGRDLIFGGGGFAPTAKNQSKERYRRDICLSFTPEVKHTPWKQMVKESAYRRRATRRR